MYKNLDYFFFSTPRNDTKFKPKVVIYKLYFRDGQKLQNLHIILNFRVSKTLK